MTDCFCGCLLFLCTHSGSGEDKAMKWLAVCVIAIHLLSQSRTVMSLCIDDDNSPFIPLSCCVNETEIAFQNCQCEDTCDRETPKVYTLFCPEMPDIPLLQDTHLDNDVGCL